MAISNTLPDCKKIVYNLDKSGQYQSQDRPALFFKMPLTLRLEQPQRKEIIKADYVAYGNLTNSELSFIAGLLPTKHESWYFSDYFERKNGIKKNSFVLFNLTPNKAVLTVYFYNLHKVYPNKRKSFIDAQIRLFDTKKGSENPTPNYQIIDGNVNNTKIQ